MGNPGPVGMGSTIFYASGFCLVEYLGPLRIRDDLYTKIIALLFNLRLIHSKGISSSSLVKVTRRLLFDG